MGARSETRDGLALEEIGDVVVMVWRDDATVERGRRLGPFLRDVAARHAGGFLMLLVILPSSAPPDGASRAQSQGVMKELGTKLRFTSTLAIGDSFRGAVVRSIMRAMTLISGQARRHGIAATLDEALVALAQHAGPTTPSRAEIMRCLSENLRELGVQDFTATPARTGT